jgi:2-keto-4-pentenoate hydratase
VQLAKWIRFLILCQTTLMLYICIGCQSAKESIHSEKITAMVDAQQAHNQITPITHTYGEFSMDEAYELQAELSKKISNFLGPLAGYKVAYASNTAREQLGMDEPARGPYFLTQRIPSGSSLPSEIFNEITLETEIAFTIGKRIYTAIRDVETVKKHVKWLHAAFDAGDFPYQVDHVKSTPEDMVAIGTGAHVFVLGPAMPASINIDDIPLEIIRNGKVIRKSSSKQVMGSPWNSMLWCANHLVASGLTLEPGFVILCGTAAPAYKVKGNAIKGNYVGTAGPLGQVTTTIE